LLDILNNFYLYAAKSYIYSPKNGSTGCRHNIISNRKQLFPFVGYEVLSADFFCHLFFFFKKYYVSTIRIRIKNPDAAWQRSFKRHRGINPPANKSAGLT